MSVWFVVPSARADGDCRVHLGRWLSQGYKIALWRNGTNRHDTSASDYTHLELNTAGYYGWGPSVNVLSRVVFEIDPACNFIVTGGDDTDPDMNHSPEEIEADCLAHFGGTFGVLQNTGDRWGADEPWAKAMFPDAPAYIDRICGSPWIGRSFAERAHSGAGPFHPDFFHMFADESLLEYAKMLGVLWQRRDLIHFHDHPRRDGIPRTPDFAAATGIYGSEEWERGKAILARLKAEKFASCLPK